MSDSYPDGLKRSPVGAVYEQFHDRRPAPVAKSYDDFPPLSDEEYGQMQDDYEAKQQSGDAMAKRVGNMKRQAHAAPAKPKPPPDPVAQAMKSMRKVHGLASKARGRRR